MTPAAEIPVAALRAAARRPEVVAAIAYLYKEVEAEIAARHPTCWNLGRCCQFGRYGHRLYVTGLEVAYYLAKGGGAELREVDEPPAEACPHVRDGRCHAREQRPLGCRIFYCDPAAQHWQGPLTEGYLARLRALHEQLAVPYVYADWLTVLRALGE